MVSETRSMVEFCRERSPGWMDLLEVLVNQDSPSGDAEGVRAVLDLLIPRFAAFGFSTELVGKEGGPHLVAERSAEKPGAPRVLILGHADTVFPRGTVEKRPFSIRNGRAYGPGVADMKGGLVGVLGMLEALGNFDLLDGMHLVVCINGDEEIGSPGSRVFIDPLAERSDAAFVFEPGRPDGSIVNKRRGSVRGVLEVTGKSAHSGVDPEAGASAILALAHKVTALHALSDHRAEVSVNVGVISGGERPNMIADYARGEIDVRFSTAQDHARLKQALAEIAAKLDVEGTTGVFEITIERPPMIPQPGAEILLELYRQVSGEMEENVPVMATGGGSDGNLTSAKGVPTVDALGPCGGRFHSDEEYLEIDSLATRAALSAQVLARLPESGLGKRT